MKRTQEEIESLRGKLRKIEQKICPRQKFRFSCRNPPPSSSSGTKSKSKADVGDPTADLDVVPSTEPTTFIPVVPAGSFSVSHKEKEDITVTLNDFPNLESKTSAQLFISECKSTTISAQFVLGSVRLENLTDCTIALGPCRTSIYLENCINCNIFLVCHQLRIHNTHKCQLFVLVNSAPIIEDCSKLEFAPNKTTYELKSQDLQDSSLVDAKYWNNVIDFRWHKSIASPHWRALLPMEYERIVLSPTLVHRGWSLIGPSPPVTTVATTEVVDVQPESAPVVAVANDEDDEDEI